MWRCRRFVGVVFSYVAAVLNVVVVVVVTVNFVIVAVAIVDVVGVVVSFYWYIFTDVFLCIFCFIKIYSLHSAPKIEKNKDIFFHFSVVVFLHQIYRHFFH